MGQPCRESLGGIAEFVSQQEVERDCGRGEAQEGEPGGAGELVRDALFRFGLVRVRQRISLVHRRRVTGPAPFQQLIGASLRTYDGDIAAIGTRNFTDDL